MHQSETRAEETYKVVILKYPKSVKILRAYVRFLREIKNDPWKAQRYDLQADNYEQVKAMATVSVSSQHITVIWLGQLFWHLKLSGQDHQSTQVLDHLRICRHKGRLLRRLPLLQTLALAVASCLTCSVKTTLMVWS